MYIETITGDKLLLNIKTNNLEIVKKELNKKYGYKINSIYLHWTGKKFIFGLFNELVCEGIINNIVFDKKKVEKDKEIETLLDFLALKDKKSLTKEDKKIIYGNLDEFLKEKFSSKI